MPRKWLLSGRKETYSLKDPDKPELFEDLFPPDGIPKIVFDDTWVEMNPPDEIFITDTTFRDGQQARPPYTVEQIVDLYDMLHELGGPHGVIRMSEFFLYSAKDREAVRRCQKRGYEYPKVTGWIRARKEDFDLVKKMELDETGILTSCSDYHIHFKFGKKRSEVMKSYLDVARAAIDAEIVPRCHLEDLTRADFFGFVIPFVRELMKLSQESGMPVKIRLCDTMGFGIPYPNASLPRGVPKLVSGMINDGGVPSEWLEWHGHDDFHRVHSNSVTAWLYGCANINGTLLSIGERTGNSPIEALIIEYIELMGKNNGIDTTVITKIADYYRKEIGYEIPPRYPLVGRDFAKTSAGIHIDAVLKNPLVYSIFDTEKILNRPPEIAITDKSGSAGVAFWVDRYFGLMGDKRINKDHPSVQKIKECIDKEYEAGRTTAISEEEMVSLAKKYLPEYFAR